MISSRPVVVKASLCTVLSAKPEYEESGPSRVSVCICVYVRERARVRTSKRLQVYLGVAVAGRMRMPLRNSSFVASDLLEY